MPSVEDRERGGGLADGGSPLVSVEERLLRRTVCESSEVIEGVDEPWLSDAEGAPSPLLLDSLRCVDCGGMEAMTGFGL